MNFKVLALVVMGITFLFDTVIEYLNSKSAERKIPDNVADIYDAEEYRKWLAYDKECNKLSLYRHLVSYVIAFVLIGFDVYAQIVNGIGADGLYAAAMVVMVADTVISLIWSTPFSYVRNMGIEQKYGFNRMTKKTFFVDLVK